MFSWNVAQDSFCHVTHRSDHHESRRSSFEQLSFRTISVYDHIAIQLCIKAAALAESTLHHNIIVDR
jgi:hypothetical protein